MRSAMIARHSCTVYAAASRALARTDRRTVHRRRRAIDLVGGFGDRARNARSRTFAFANLIWAAG